LRGRISEALALAHIQAPAFRNVGEAHRSPCLGCLGVLEMSRVAGRLRPDVRTPPTTAMTATCLRQIRDPETI
jgi:hypothetical protein